MKDVKEKKCGCIIYEVGPPVLCEEHQAKAARKAAREQKREEKGLRKLVTGQALDNGHDLTQFREYQSQPGKWTAHCHRCGGLVIVYDRLPERGDQIAGRVIFERCAPGLLVGTLSTASDGEEAEGTSGDDAAVSSEL